MNFLLRHILFGALITVFVSASHADEISKAHATIAAKSAAVNELLNEYSESYALAKLCAYRVESINQYYAEEYRRALRRNAPGRMAKDDVDFQVGIAINVVAFIFDEQFKEKRVSAQQCAEIRKAIDQEVPRGYDQ